MMEIAHIRERLTRIRIATLLMPAVASAALLRVNIGSSLLRYLFACAIACFVSVVGAERAAAETVKLALFKVIPSGPIFVAKEKGYFAAEGLTVELNYFFAGAPAAVAVASGDIDIAASGLSAGFYSLAGQGALRIVAGTYRELPGFHGMAYLASNRGYAAGLKSLKDFQGHSVAVAQIGAPDHYSLGLLAEKYGFDIGSIRVSPVQSIPNIASAVAGGQTDAGLAAASVAIPMAERGDAKLLGWVGDETPWQVAVIFTATKTTNDKRDMLDRFLRAYRRGAHEYHDAFAGPDEMRRDGPGAPEILAIMSKYLEVPSAQIALGIAYDDPDGRLDVKDVLHQIDWYKSHGMLKGEISGEEIVDKRYVVPLPER